MRSAASGRLIFLRFSRHSDHCAAFLAKAFSDQFGHFAVFFRNRAEAETPDEFRVAFLLAGDDLVDNHRAARGDGFLHDRAAGFADDQVMGHHQFGHLVRPAEDADAVGLLARALNQLGAQIGVAPDGDGEMHVVQFEQPVNGLAGLFLAGVDDVKHAARFASDRRTAIRPADWQKRG